MKAIRQKLPHGMKACALAAFIFTGAAATAAQATDAIPPAITTPDKVETRIGTLDFKNGMPSKETADKVYDNLDFTHAFEAFVSTYQGVSLAAARRWTAKTLGVLEQ
jgi:hypothetical protein